jgi:hypothetical protein
MDQVTITLGHGAVPESRFSFALTPEVRESLLVLLTGPPPA